MLTLIRPEKSKIADIVEQKLGDMLTAYEVLYKEVSSIPYLIVSGKVFSGESIMKFLDDYQKGLDFKTSAKTYDSHQTYEF